MKQRSLIFDKNRSLVPFIVLAVLMLCIILFNNPEQLQSMQQWSPINLRPTPPSCLPRREFVKYLPSKWEKAWYDGRAQFASYDLAVCEVFEKEGSNAEKWISSVRNGEEEAKYQDPSIFSKFVYRDSCTDQEHLSFIEPLVGNFRHPYAIPECKPPGTEIVDIEDRNYILTIGMNTSDFRTLYPGKKYFFDMGTAMYPTSLGWFVPHFAQKGVIFDEIWAWEEKIFDPEKYWKVSIE
jgi:hypothetical protein